MLKFSAYSVRFSEVVPKMLVCVLYRSFKTLEAGYVTEKVLALISLSTDYDESQVKSPEVAFFPKMLQ